jgi:hypothetical protein
MKGSETMKFKMALAAMALMLVGASAQAQLSIVLDLGDPAAPTSVADGTAPGRVEFSGTIFNIGNTTLEIVGDSVSAPQGVATDLPQSDLIIGSFPLILAPGESFRGDYLFGLDIPAGATSFGGTYAVDTLDNAGNQVAFGADYRVNIPQVIVPEPGTMALLVSGLVGGSLFLVRRRRK